MLDEYTRKYVEDAFGCQMVNVYASCEAGSNIAFECLKGSWHIHSDFFHIEAIDENSNLVAPKERGHMVITRLWGDATPIIRYSGMKDWITLSDGRRCSCGLQSPIFETIVEGRVMSNIVLPNGKVYPPSAFLFITSILTRSQPFKVRKFQIIQKKIDEIEIQLVIDNEVRNTGVSVEEIMRYIKKVYEDKVGPDVRISVVEVDKIIDDPNTGKPAPLVVSKVTSKESCQIKE
jgi:phenylacetate-coenzyme A ligase PaaK-like adenylate-forming protein